MSAIKVTLIASDHQSFEVDVDVASESPILRERVENADPGDDMHIPVPSVTGEVLAKVVEYCQYYVAAKKKGADDEASNSDDDVKVLHVQAWDAQFVNVDQNLLFDIILAANYLAIKSLLDLTCQAVAQLIKGKTPAEICKTFNIKNEFTPEEEEEIRHQAAKATQPTIGKGKAAKARLPGRWVDRDCNAALNMQRVRESKWRPLELCSWPVQPALPVKASQGKGGTSGCEAQHQRHLDALVWEVLVSLPWQPRYTYKYVLINGTGEDGEPKVDKSETCEHSLVMPEGLKNGDVIEVLDTWIDNSYPGSILRSCAFTKVLKVTRLPLAVPQRVAHKEPVVGEVVVRFKVADYMLAPHQMLCVSGSIPQLGAWQPDLLLPLTEVEGLWWEGEVRVPFAHFPFTFKYAVKDLPAGTPGDSMLLEVGEPRLVTLPLAGAANMGAPCVLVCNDGFFRRDKLWRGAGVAVPVFSLRTRDSVGCGEFLDLLKLVDFCARQGQGQQGAWAGGQGQDKSRARLEGQGQGQISQALTLSWLHLLTEGTEGLLHSAWRRAWLVVADCRSGLHLIQLLPVNDTCVHGTCAASAAAAHLPVLPWPLLQYLSPRALRRDLPPDLLEELEAARLSLDGRQVDYEATVTFKIRFARKAWFREQAAWLRPYAAFCFLKDLFQTAEHWQWGTLATPPSKETLDRLTSPQADHYPAVAFTYYLQFHLHLQLLTVTRQAEAARVVLKGDVPIGVDKRSVDTWCEPHLFNMDKSTGSPPDVFDANGQNWGFPTYNWDEMAADNFSWWQRRLRHMAQYFHAYRIDHVLGFFRIWEIPGDCVTGLQGHFKPSVPIRRSELEQRGIWDLERLTEPYIRGHLLLAMFGKMWQEVAAKYLVETSEGCFRLRPQYSSERAIMDIKVREDSPHWLVEETERVRRGLLQLRQNVCLLRDPTDKDAFYPRFNLMSSTSYKECDAGWKSALAWLHDDYYYRRQEEVWRASAMRKLPVLLGVTDMLVCGEDLGFVPACVPPVMQELGLVGLRIQRIQRLRLSCGAASAAAAQELGLVGLRIQRMSTEPGREFNTPSAYPYLVVASPSCHDVLTTRACPRPSRVKNKPKPAPTGQVTPTPTHKQARLVYNTSSSANSSSANSSSANTSSAGNSSGDDGSNDDGSASSEGWVGSKLAAGVAGCKKSAVGVVGKARAAAGVAGRTRSASGVAGQTGAAARVAGRTKSATRVFALAKAAAWVTARARKFECSEEDAEICRHCKQPQEHHDFIGEVQYEDDPERRDRFYFSALGGSGEAPAQCTPDIMRVDIMALCAKYYDRAAQEEVINDPTNPRHYWRFRLHVSLEELCQDSSLVGVVQDMLISSGRAEPLELLH
ncbi:hypothetical protein QJQ45_007717 [Haematococcus lacustris]|nr:hypothetical protein QJQ45_007717 [Haematococcus lacustris]